MKKSVYITAVRQHSTYFDYARLWEDDEGKLYLREKKSSVEWAYIPIDNLPCKDFVSYCPGRIFKDAR